MSAPKQPQDNTQEQTADLEQSSSAEELSAMDDANDETIQVPETSDLAAELSEAQAKVSEYYDQLLRAKAEVENIRRRGRKLC